MVDILLQKIIMNAYNNVPFYTNYFRRNRIDPLSICHISDLQKVPLVNKDQIQKTRDEFCSTACNIKSNPYNELMELQTSGTTGIPFSVLWLKRDYISSMFHHWRFRQLNFGINASHRFCSFEHHGRKKGAIIEFKNENRELCLNKNYFNNSILEAYYELMVKFNPDWLFIQSSIAYLLIGYIQENHLDVPKGLKYIELIGEHLFDSYRDYIMKSCSIPITNMYGCTETNGIAYECRYRNFHILKNNVVVETIKDGEPVGYGKEGDVFVTSLCNTAMPIIRYSLGDRAILYPGSICSCGSKNPVIKLVAGRLGEFFFAGGTGSYKASKIIYPLNKLGDITIKKPYIEFQVNKVKSNEYTYLFIKNDKIVLNDNLNNDFKSELTKIGFKNIKLNITSIDRPYPNLHKGLYTL